VLVVKGKASHDFYSGEVRISADELFDIEQARSQLARHMQIQLNAGQLNSNVVSRLRTILAHNDDGQCGVGFQYRNDSGICQLDVAHEWRIVPNKIMLEQLESIVGLASIRLIY